MAEEQPGDAVARSELPDLGFAPPTSPPGFLARSRQGTLVARTVLWGGLGLALVFVATGALWEVFCRNVSGPPACGWLDPMTIGLVVSTAVWILALAMIINYGSGRTANSLREKFRRERGAANRPYPSQGARRL